jgi:putative restriction endonuclease
MTLFIAVTDKAWFEQLSVAGNLEEVNFWQPSPDNAFRALMPGELFLFKLHSPDNYVVGGGLFSHWTRLLVSIAWDAFGIKNGASNLREMRARIERYRRIRPAPHEDYEIGCVLLQQPFFFSRVEWLPVPDWHLNIVRGKGYDSETEPGRSLWQLIQDRLISSTSSVHSSVRESGQRYGKPVLVQQRLGQGSFRILVTDLYNRSCAVTGGRALPVLVAAHIRSYSEGGEHRVDNGLLLRSDLHTLFDRGYVTVTPEYRLEVGKRLRTDFENGEEYFVWHGKPITLPARSADRPRPEFLTWHNQNRFLG